MQVAALSFTPLSSVHDTVGNRERPPLFHIAHWMDKGHAHQMVLDECGEENMPCLVIRLPCISYLFLSWLFVPFCRIQAAGREDSSMNLRKGDMFIVRYRPIRNLVLEGRVDLI